MEKPALTASDFAAFFEAIWGHKPFPWQERLLYRLDSGEDPHHAWKGEPGLWPDVLDLPTGSGKTAALDIAVFHLALEAAKGPARRAPLRIAFVVDRRLIVDDAFGRAKTLAAKLETAIKHPQEAHPVVLAVAERLSKLAGSGQPPLVTRALRGGVPREDDWARTPVQPTILCSTVDQVGSRLLFRGYGVSDRMKPIHAGLLGSDCLILLDEAHLANPFRETLAAVEHLRAPDKALFGVALLTATPGIEAKRRFGLSPEDDADRVLSRRLAAAKPARLESIAGKQGIEAESLRADVAAETVKAMLADLKGDGVERPAVGVVLNRVARARAVYERLHKAIGDTHKVILVIGPARSVDRDGLGEDLKPIRTGQVQARSGIPEPFVVVATQTIEAGVDLDFDGLVTEAASLDALRQRFGRLNRDGRPIAARAVVLAHKEDIAARADDPVYGDRIRTTWEALQRWAGALDAPVDFGIRSMEAILKAEPDGGDGLFAVKPSAPVLMPAYAHLWSQTAPIPAADPDVALFLHGPNRSPASIQIVWRADIERSDFQKDDEPRLVELLGLVPPRAAEAIDVPLWTARAFLKEDRSAIADLSDIAERPPEEADGGSGRPAFLWAGEDGARTGIVRADNLRPGDLIVVPAAYGGCDEWGWNPKSPDAVPDVADGAAWLFRGKRLALRVTPELVMQSITRSTTADGKIVSSETIASELAELLSTRGEDGATALLEAVVGWCERKEKAVGGDGKTTSLSSRLRQLLEKNKGLQKPAFVYGLDDQERPRGVVFVAPRGLDPDGKVAEDSSLPSTENDEEGAASNQPLGLLAHCEHVREWAAAFAGAAGLPAERIVDVALAAFLHDPGKADPRYQSWYAGGDPYGPEADKVLAKSGKKRLPRGSWKSAGLPDHWRHEALSVRLALMHPEFAKAPDPYLVLWLIGTHHGHGRPLFPHADPMDAEPRLNLLAAFDDERTLEPGFGPQSLAFDFEGLDWTGLFDRLKAEYGIWGLARLEAFVCLADHRASEAEAGPPDSAGMFREAAE